MHQGSCKKENDLILCLVDVTRRKKKKGGRKRNVQDVCKQKTTAQSKKVEHTQKLTKENNMKKTKRSEQAYL